MSRDIQKTFVLLCTCAILFTGCKTQSPLSRVDQATVETTFTSATARETHATEAVGLPAVDQGPIPPSVTNIPASATPTPQAHPSPTAAPTPIQPARFAVIGDYGSGDENALAVAELVLSWDPDFIITTGDNNYPLGGADTIDANIGQFYSAFIHPYRGVYGAGAPSNRFFPALGNHDWDTPGAQPFLDYFELPGNERYYAFAWGPVHLFAIDSDSREPDGVRRASSQASWLQQGLADSEAPWKIVYMHHPPYSSGPDGPIQWMQWPYAAWGADAVLAGHAHVYERITVAGFPYVTNGLGGGERYYFQTIDPGSQVRYRDDYGAMLVEADQKNITFHFINIHGEVIDVFSLSGGP